MAASVSAMTPTTSDFRQEDKPVITVYTRALWSDSWAVNRRLIPSKVSLSIQPTMPTARFFYDFGEVMRPTDTGYTTVDPPDLRGQYVKITQTVAASGAATDEDDETAGTSDWEHFVGIFVDPELAYGETQSDLTPYDAGFDSSTYVALGMENLLDRVVLRQSVVGSSETKVNHVMPMNLRHSVGGSLLGNRSTSKPGSADSHVHSADGAVWTHKDYVEYLLDRFTPSGIGFFLSGIAADALDEMKSTGNFSGMTLRQILNILIDRRRGLFWNAFVREGLPYIYISVGSLFAKEIVIGEKVIRPAQSWVDLSVLDDKHVSQCSIREIDTEQVDTLIVRGERIRVCSSYSFTDSTIEAGWETGATSEQKDYETATAGRDDPEDVRFERVFTHFRVPNAWNFQVKDGVGGTANNVNITVTKDGQLDTTNTSNMVRDFKRFLPLLPLESGKKYTTTTVADYADNSGDPVSAPYREFLRPFAIIKNTKTNAGSNYDFCHKPSGKWGSKSAIVRPDEHDLAMRVIYRPQLTLAEGRFQTAAASLSAYQHTESNYDWQELIFTAAIEIDQHLEVTWENIANLDSGEGREVVIDVPNMHMWLLAPGTVVGINDTDATVLLRSDATSWTTLRDDGAKLRAIAILAQAWFSIPRRALVFARDVLDLFAEPGMLVSDFIGGHRTTEINTVISRVDIDYDVGRVTIQTGYDELDFSGFAASTDLSGVGVGDHMRSRLYQYDALALELGERLA